MISAIRATCLSARFLAGLLASILLLQAGVAGAAEQRPKATPSTVTAPSQPVAEQVQVPAEAKVGADYVIGPGDTLQVFVWRNPELTVTVPVRPDGKITTPLVQDLVAVGKTPSILARDIEKLLAEYVRSPQVNIIVTQPASAFSQVKIIGQVARPQSLAYRDGLTVLDAVLAAGGLTPFAAGNRAKVVRTENGKSRDIKIKLTALVDKGDLSQNLSLQPGDVVVIPESIF